MDRYSRQILFEPIGEEGQKQLLRSRVVIVGLGALGSVLADLSARAGIGSIVLVDRDFLEESNLQRQSLFDENDVRENLPKAIAAERKLKQINSAVKMRALVMDVNPSNVEHLVKNASLVLDGTDNFETRYLLNEACVKHGVPWIYGAAVGSVGVTMTILPRQTPCLRCIFEQAPPPGMTPTCETAGVLSAVTHLIASLEFASALKLLTGKNDAGDRGILSVDVWANRFHATSLKDQKPRSDCPVCSHGQFEYLQGRATSQTVRLCGRNAVQILPGSKVTLSLESLKKKLARVGAVSSNRFLVRCQLGPQELIVFSDGRAIVRGTTNEKIARALYAKYLGG